MLIIMTMSFTDIDNAYGNFPVFALSSMPEIFLDIIFRICILSR